MLLIRFDGHSGAVALQTASEALKDAKPRIGYEYGKEFVNREVAAFIKARNPIDKTGFG